MALSPTGRLRPRCSTPAFQGRDSPHYFVKLLKGRGRTHRGVNALLAVRDTVAMYGPVPLLRPFMAESLSPVICKTASCREGAHSTVLGDIPKRASCRDGGAAFPAPAAPRYSPRYAARTLALVSNSGPGPLATMRPFSIT